MAWVDTGAARLRYLEAGSGGETVVFVHGLGGQIEIFLHSIAAQARHRRTLAFDLIGHGYSAKPDGAYEIADYIRCLEWFLAAVAPEPVHLVGLAMGGWICARFASRRSERVASLTLVAPGGYSLRTDVMAKMASLSSGAGSGRDAVRSRLEWLVSDKAAITDELVDIRWRIYRRADSLHVLPSLLRLQDPEIRQRNLLRPEELAAIKVPTLVMWAAADPIGPMEEGRAIAATIAGARFVPFERSGHMLHLEEPRKFDATLADFLQTASASRSAVEGTTHS